MSEQNTVHEDLLLINPPLCSIHGPYLGIPVLADYLRCNGVGVEAFDLNQAFFRTLLNEKHIGEGMDYLNERFTELNSLSQLRSPELVEYRRLVRLLEKSRQHQREIETLQSASFSFEALKNSPSIPLLIELATSPFFPETVDFSPGIDKQECYSPYSSSELISSIGHDSFYTQRYREIIKDAIINQRQPPRIVGFSVVMNSQIVAALQCAAILKKYWKNSHFVLGGAYISIHMREIANPGLFDIVDSLILDAGEDSLLTLYREMTSGLLNLRRVSDLIFREAGQIVRNARKQESGVSVSCTADYSIFDLDSYFYSRDRLMAYLCFSRGCEWKRCTFCRTGIPTFSNHCQPAASQLFEHLREMVEQYGFRKFHFATPYANPIVLRQLAELILENKLKVQWSAGTKVSDQFTEETGKLFRRSGCARLSFGIESFSDRILRLMKKGTSVRQIEKMLQSLRGTIPIRLFMMTGFPTETVEEAEQGFSMIQALCKKSLIHGYSYNILHLTYGSDLWENPETYHIHNIRYPGNHDLKPNVIDFDCSGMSRLQAVELKDRFTLRLPDLFRSNRSQYSE